MIFRPPAARLGRHGLAFAAIVLALLPVVGSSAVWSADVGAQLHQSARLLDGDGWTTTHPLPDVDPDGHLYGMHLAQRPVLASGDPHEYVTLAKHPFLTWTVAGLLSVGGFRAVLLLSTAGTIASALAAGRLTELTRPDLAPWSLWVTGLGSPLFFDAYIGYAHTVAAAAVAWAAYFALKAVDGQSTRRHLLASASLLGLACLARTEAALAAAALSGSLALLGATGWTTGTTARRAFAASASLTAGAVVAVGADRLLALAVTGPANPAWRPTSPSFLVGRWLGFAQTWLNPGRTPADLFVVVAAIALLVVVAAVGRRQLDEGPSSNGAFHRSRLLPVAGGVVALMAVVARGLVAEPVMVAGLLFAFPLLVAGIVVTRRAHLDRGPVQVCLVAFGLYAVGVLATQYSYGGVAEWGGRYFAAGIPLGVAAVIVPLADTVSRLPLPTRRATVALFASAALGLNLLGINSLRDVRQSTSELIHHIDVANGSLADEEGVQPLVVSTVPLAGRVSWSIFDDTPWLLVDSNELAVLATSLRDHGFEAFTLVSFSPDVDRRVLAGTFEPDGAESISSDAVVIMRASQRERVD